MRGKADINTKIGPTTKKILLLLAGGFNLSIAGRPDYYFRAINGISKEWKQINKRALYEAIRNLYKSKMVDYKENEDGTVSVVLTESGKTKTLQYNLDLIKIKKPVIWDKLWRLVIFDIPETQKQGRNSLALKLKDLGFIPIQRSVFIYPYECKNEIDFIIEIFNLKPYVRFMLVKETDIDLDLKHRFHLR
ncbi:hypothetical protein COV23_02260 [Candidatus Wolfebacteria bacterium CG10_big_fil_rev_8_21_14_0_10_31_9]|uniref:Transcriptional repressor PaaX-like central Cas2-like domain-containing protein n=1 Tax=Candidatus Wolfebacteria bacterium CG10_big_fil_rev_8_21_14_0_10_31_9 TaxID=1975070 RepID=A0A2H0RDW1_9BACT|nr:MAG: hypothetical protein COV23_02260 [Candidatus Wolfebacteria bacterium CG10_big_fil_rev_8_21_14_0_10_31_9]